MLRLTKSGKRKYVSLGLSVEERFWDFKKNSPKRNCPDRDAILAVIERKSKQYREQITQFKVEGKDYTLGTLIQIPRADHEKGYIQRGHKADNRT